MTKDNVFCAVAGIALGALILFAAIGVATLTIGSQGVCTIAHLSTQTSGTTP